MKTLLILIALAAVLSIGLLLFRKYLAGRTSDAAWPFYLKKVMSAPEQILYHRLVAALPDHIVLAQVQMSRVVGVTKDASGRQQWQNRVSQKSLDFVVCSKDATVVAAIELDDRTHEKKIRIEADDVKAKALAAAGVNLIRWHVGALPDERAIRAALSKEPPLTVVVAAQTEKRPGTPG